MTIHHRNLQRLAIEMYEVKNNLCPLPVREIFNSNVHAYDLRNKKTWEQSNVRTVFYGTETVRYGGPKIWDILPSELKVSKSLEEFKSKVKLWKPVGCTCRICKIYISDLGFVDKIS